jgi:hypothetical protein
MVALVSATLNASIESVMNDGNGYSTCKRCPAIERSISSTFQALPKNGIGRLAPQAVRHIVRSYFVKEHGWFIQGLDLDGIQKIPSAADSAGMLRAKAPAMIEAMLEARRAGRGLTFEDIVAMVATLERLILLESLELIEGAYAANNLSSNQLIEESDFHEVMLSFVLMYRQDESAIIDDPEGHMRNKTEAAAISKERGGDENYWGQLLAFEQSGVKAYELTQRHKLNPFTARRFSPDSAVRVAESLVHDFGKWQNEECMAMKEALMPLDPKGTGRVPLKVFWEQPETEIYSFTESREYLRSAGALDESPNQAPSVRIANYVSGPSNCIAQSGYTAICCLDGCANLMGDLEGIVQGPTAEPLQLLGLVQQNLSSATVDAPRKLSDALASKLHLIADKNGGSVPLHGRLFAQWMHFAFPNECPYPAEAPLEKSVPGNFNRSLTLNSTEKIMSSQNIGEHGIGASSAAIMDSHWRDTEILPLLEVVDSGRGYISFLSSAMALTSKVALIALGAKMAFGMWKSALARASGDSDEKKVGTIV